MNISIIRGADQIGGCITEISSDNCKILIDLGSNLPGTDSEEFSSQQIHDITKDADAIFYTHYHGDHVGLMGYVPKNIPQFIGKGAKEVLKIKYKTLHKEDYLAIAQTMHTYEADKRIDVAGKGEICVTPYFISHSAFDAYMFKIECEGKTILHTGDFRGHGFIGNKLPKLLTTYIGQVDILITEGTMLGRKQEPVITENDIKKNAINFLKSHKYVYALCSSTDMDRLAAFHDACKKNDRVFVVDTYQKEVLNVFTKFSGSIVNLFDFSDCFELGGLNNPKIQKLFRWKGFLMPVRASQIKLVRALMQIYNDEPSWLLYSMWGGYAIPNRSYTNNSIIELRALFGNNIMDGVKDKFHTSGHADIETLQEVCKIVKPRIGIIPIHKEKSTHFEDLPEVKNYKVFTDGEYEISNIHISVK